MWSFLKNYSDAALLILRLALGGLILYLYGWPWLAAGADHWRSEGLKMTYLGIDAVPRLWGFLAACAASLGSVFFILGFAFRPTCLLGFLTLTAIAVIEDHGHSLRAAANATELAVVMFALFFIGPGKVSVDKA